jgi:uncharacterized membrane protein YbhN (UPF0104 family)
VRIFRGRKFPLRYWLPHVAAIVLALILPIGVMWWFVWRGHAHNRPNMLPKAGWFAVYAGLVALAWLVIWGMFLFFNWLIKVMPKIRRTIRPWLRHRGIDLLPPRLRRRVHLPDGTFDFRKHPEGDIFRVHERHRARFRILWNVARPWLKRALSFFITLAIFALMMRPVARNWDQVAPRVKSIHWGLFVAAAAMFALFLFAFRALAWRKILAGFGYRLPIPAATRIWSTSELARYLPGVIWQVVGRVYLVRPYGVSGTVCSVSQILELIVFMLANILLALSCLIWFGTKMDPAAKKYLYLAMALVPLLMLLLHPRVFYTLLTRYMTARRKRLPERRVRGKTLTLLTLWAVLGLIWQGLALWILTHDPLGLPIAKWWIVAGCYCLAWCAGFVAFWAPGGLGVREVVFVGALMFALPPNIRANFGDKTVLFAFLAFLGIVLR